MNHPIVDQIMLTGYPKDMAAQPEFNGIDFMQCEILTGDRIVIDEGEIILAEHLDGYLQGEHEFQFFQGRYPGKDYYGNEIEIGDRLAYDSKKENIINMEWDDDFEAYLVTQYEMKFTIAE
ncbi:hypothetical protein [Bacillus sp. FJAT-49736]|uniref:YqaI family protein n=1 Tax=Bacillus sp. FJAT-49736 TaxID=2833582 RepID=UPI001BC97D7E|nr:hypothetical protein [Bacillus sp. FJAT-49736]MBS4173513.1 hypothetical protein [Bacillus sp. FJAT-49736]